MILGAIVIALLLFVPAAVAADPSQTHDGRVLVSTGGDVTLPAGEHADAVVVVRGHATIAGDANTIVVVDGSADLQGATAETIWAVRSSVTIGAGSAVLGDVMTADAVITQAGDAQVTGTVRDIGLDVAGIGFLLGPLFFALYMGFALAAVAAALLLAGLAAKQVRAAETLIGHEPGSVVIAGLAGIFLPLIVVTVLFLTVVGAPLALGILLGLWPLTAFLGYLVAAIWIGEWILGKISRGVERERPYLGAIIGVLVLQVLAIWPILSSIAAFVGFGAVLLLAWRTLRSGSATQTVANPSTPAVAAG